MWHLAQESGFQSFAQECTMSFVALEHGARARCHGRKRL